MGLRKGFHMTRVGLLEDNARIAKMSATMLRFAGYSVDIYKHPQECLNAFRQSTVEETFPTLALVPPISPIELLILDLHLPGMSGIEVLHQLQELPQARRLPLIFCTAANPRDIVQALRIAPHAHVIEKPFKLDALVAAVATTLNVHIPQ
jgi:CheY-like chemotaxis protein